LKDRGNNHLHQRKTRAARSPAIGMTGKIPNISRNSDRLYKTLVRHIEKSKPLILRKRRRRSQRKREEVTAASISIWTTNQVNITR